MKKRVIAALLAATLVLGNSMSVLAEEDSAFEIQENEVEIAETGNLSLPSQAEIIQKYKEAPFVFENFGYEQEPSVEPPYALGKPSQQALDNALNLLNFIRYVAGVRSNIRLNEKYNELAQGASLISAVNDSLSHDPEIPEGFTKELGELCSRGAGSCNLAYSVSIANAMRLWLVDGDSTNIKHVGHRQWVLNPNMQEVGFGQVGIYEAMYAFDYAPSEYISDQFISWPAANMPMELMMKGCPWSVNLCNGYGGIDEDSIEVTLTNIGTGQKWVFNKASSQYENNYFSVDDKMFVGGQHIIFRPNIKEITYEDGSQFQVDITGLVDDSGEPKSLSYTVNFFYIEPPQNDTGDSSSGSDENNPGDGSSNNNGVQDTQMPYVDVRDGDWYYDGAQAVYNRGIMTGMDATHFGPSVELSRGQFATILHRMEGAPAIEFNPDAFPDIQEGWFYTGAAMWAKDTGVIRGYEDNGCFGPSDSITREQMAVMMYRYAGYRQLDTSVKGSLDEFPDAGSVSDFAKEAVEWAVGVGLITGDGGKINPQGNAERAQCATIIMRFINSYGL